jgi:hypothetical protein
MNRFLLINNQEFFNKHNVITIGDNCDIPNKNAILFIGSHTKSVDDPNHIFKYFETIGSKPYQYIIIVGKGDGCLDPKIKIPENIKSIYCTNVNYTHNKIKFLPMGCDFRSIHSFGRIDITKEHRDILCYCNFSTNTHQIRNKIYQDIRNKEFITFRHMGNFLNYNISRDQFFDDINNSKFVICPRGNAIDTFRFYDTIYAGAIPIVVRTNYHKLPFFENVPILFLEKEEDYKNLTQDFLNKEYEILIKKRGFYYWLDFDNFIKELYLTLTNS